MSLSVTSTLPPPRGAATAECSDRRRAARRRDNGRRVRIGHGRRALDFRDPYRAAARARLPSPSTPPTAALSGSPVRLWRPGSAYFPAGGSAILGMPGGGAGSGAVCASAGAAQEPQGPARLTIPPPAFFSLACARSFVSLRGFRVCKRSNSLSFALSCSLSENRFTLSGSTRTKPCDIVGVPLERSHGERPCTMKSSICRCANS